MTGKGRSVRICRGSASKVAIHLSVFMTTIASRLSLPVAARVA